MDQGTGGVPRREIRVSDAERDQAVAELSEHFQSGRLTQEEFEDRSGRALQARTVSDLAGLFNDLPHNVVPAPTPPMPAMGPRMRLPLVPIIVLGVILAILAGPVYGSSTHHHSAFGLLVPIVILCMVVLRATRRYNRR
jgi:Domain of unknown function (DUF1707)